MAQTYYDVLGVAENATGSEIEAAFKNKAREVHPDRVGSNSPYLQRIAAEVFKELSEAKSVLLDHHRREKYDSALAYMRGSSASTAAPPRPPRSASVGVPRCPSARATAPSPPTPHPATKLSFWKTLNTKVGPVAILIGISGCAVILSALTANETMTVLGTALVIISLALFCWRHGIRLRIDAKVLGGSVFLFLISIMSLSAWYGLLSNYSLKDWRSLGDGQAYRSSSQGANLSAARPSDDLRSTPTQPPPVFEQKTSIIPPLTQKLDISSLSREERQSIEAACSSAKYVQGPAAYDQCIDSHLTRLASGPRRPDLSGLTFDEKQSIEAVCSDAKYLRGPTEYNRCVVNQLDTLKASRR